MADAQDFKDKFMAVFNGMTLGQKMTISTTVIVGVLGFVFLFRWATQPDYALLFSNLDLKEADEVVQALQAQNVPYKLTAGGSTVMVPSSQVYEMRISLASQISSGSVGYEVFDQNEIGLSDFVQKVNYRRALEGEFARTIESISGIKKARVHIVIPEDRLFKKDQNEPTASIVLHMAGNRRLRDDQIEGIANLVSAGVEGLDPGNVKIVDSRGQVLGNSYSSDSMMGMSSSQLDFQRKVESHLTDKAQSMLSAVLGEGKSYVRVTADLDFQRIEQTRENYDPQNTAVLSEERSEKTNQDPQNATGSSEYFTTNYSVPRTVEHVINEVGAINNLSISLVVDYDRRPVADVNGVMVPDSLVQRDQNQLNMLQNMVENAVGYQEGRDQISVSQLPFKEDELLEPEADYLFGVDTQYWDLAQKVLPVLFLLVFLFIIRGRLRRMRVSAAPSGRGGQLAVAGAGGGQMRVARGPGPLDEPLPQLDENAPPEAIESAKLLKQISEFVEEKPSNAVKLIRYWLLEE